MSASRLVSGSFPLFTAGAMAYGTARAYHNFQDTTSSWKTYLGITVSVSAVQNVWALILPTAASPNAAGIGVGLLTLTATSLYQGGMVYAAMMAGEQIGLAARPPMQLTTVPENRELR